MSWFFIYYALKGKRFLIFFYWKKDQTAFLETMCTYISDSTMLSSFWSPHMYAYLWLHKVTDWYGDNLFTIHFEKLHLFWTHCSRINGYRNVMSQDFFYFSMLIHNGDTVICSKIWKEFCKICNFHYDWKWKIWTTYPLEWYWT